MDCIVAGSAAGVVAGDFIFQNCGIDANLPSQFGDGIGLVDQAPSYFLAVVLAPFLGNNDSGSS